MIIDYSYRILFVFF